MTPLTITVAQAAERLGLPKATTERVARDNGLLIVAGNRKRISPDDLPEILNLCRSEPKDRALCSARTLASSSSETPGAASVHGHTRSRRG